MALCCFYYVLVWTLQFVFIVRLGLVFMGRHKCKAVACLSSQVKCNFYELLYCALYLWRINLIWFELKFCALKNHLGAYGPSEQQHQLHYVANPDLICLTTMEYDRIPYVFLWLTASANALERNDTNQNDRQHHYIAMYTIHPEIFSYCKASIARCCNLVSCFSHRRKTK